MLPESAETWRAALAHVGELLERSPEERRCRLEELARQQPELGARVRALLDSDMEASRAGFLDVTDPLEDTLTGDTLQAGAQLGPYRLVRELGVGGMGRVWLARRDDGMYEGEVAIKTLHAHLAMSALRERFRREALLLGRLQHVHIARLLDAGTADLSTYLVLEYVRGQPLEDWCTSRKLDTRARLQLFLDVCAAVAHAHANLIVHRDLKPANVLVTDEGVVKLLDFGIGKLLDTDAPLQPAATGELTQLTGRALTPDYAAPEQIRGEPVTTATDVYSLGALLFVLLTGIRPFSVPGRPAVDVEHAVLHDDAPALSRAARIAGADIRVQRTLAGDLEHIVRRAMRKLPGDRYASVLALADDVQRHIHHVPVHARSGSWTYRAGRYVRRHRIAVTLGTALALSALAGVGGIAWKSREAQEQARVARLEAAKATAVKEFLLDIFNANNQQHPEGARARLTTAEELLNIAREKILAGAPDDLEVRSELMGIQGNLFLELDKLDEASALFEARVGTLEAAYGSHDPRLVPALLDLSTHRLSVAKHHEASALANRAISLLEARGDRWSRDRAIAEHVLGYVSYLTTERRDDPTARRHFATEVAILERLPPSADLVRALYALGKAHSFSGDHAQALPPLRRGLELAKSLSGPRDPSVAAGHQVLAAALGHMRSLAEAELHQRQAMELFAHSHRADSTKMSISRMELGRILQQQGKYLAAAAEFQHAISVREKTAMAGDMWAETARVGLAQSLLGQGDFTRAQQLLDQGLTRLADGRDDNVRMVMLRTRAALHLEQRRPGEALEDAAEGLKLALVNSGPRGLPVAQAHILRAESLIGLSRLDEASTALDDASGILAGDTSAMAAPLALDLRIAQARLVLERGDAAAAAARLSGALDALRNREDRASLWPQEDAALRLQAAALLAAGQPNEACAPLDASITLRATQALPTDPRLDWARAQRSRCGGSKPG